MSTGTWESCAPAAERRSGSFWAGASVRSGIAMNRWRWRGPVDIRSRSASHTGVPQSFTSSGTIGARLTATPRNWQRFPPDTRPRNSFHSSSCFRAGRWRRAATRSGAPSTPVTRRTPSTPWGPAISSHTRSALRRNAADAPVGSTRRSRLPAML